MARLQDLLKQKAKATGTPLWVVEKDYAISYLVGAVSETALLDGLLTLKGGTALKKVYYEGYRFSEDLDYSTMKPNKEEDIHRGVEQAVKLMEQKLLQKGPFRSQLEPLELREPHPEGQIAYILRIQYPHQREPVCRLKIEITIDEQVLLSPKVLPVFHDYEEPFNAKASVYDLPEIAAEKFRALLQSLGRLQQKGWGADRASRDDYDLWWMLTKSDLTGTDIPGLTREKCAARGIQAVEYHDFFHELLVEVTRRNWDRLLVPFVSDPVEVGDVIHDLQIAAEKIWKKQVLK